MKRLLMTIALGMVFALSVGAEDGQGTPAKKWINTAIERIHLSGYAMGGFDYYDQQMPKDKYKVALIIFIANVQITDRINAYMMYDFKSSTLHEMWANYKFCPQINLKVGQFKTPFTLENTLSPTVLETVRLMSLASDYMISGGSALTMKSQCGRDAGMTIYGNLFKGFMTYDLALMNGAGLNRADDNSQKDFVGRIGVSPMSYLTLSGSVMLGTGNIAVHEDANGKVVSDLAPISDVKRNGNFTRNHYALGAQMKTKPVNLRTEYMFGKDGDLDAKGYYATGTVNNIGVKHLDLVASYDWLDIYSGKKNRYTTGLQYWFYPGCRFQVNYGYEKNDNAHDQNFILAQIQVKF